jgi:hypothetical protein
MLKRRMLLPMSIGAVMVALTAWTMAQQPAGGGSLTAQDYIDIQQLYTKYNLLIDSGDPAWADTFTPDGTFNKSAGKQELLKFVSDYVEKKTHQTLRHWNSNLQITPSPGGATGTVYLLLVNISVRPPVIATAARYEDTLVKTPQGWRFKSRTTRGEGPAPAAAPKPVQ